MKTELQKMLDGELYLAADDELVAMRRRARVLARRFNDAAPENDATRRETLRELLKKCDETTHIEPPFQCDYGAFISLGERFYANFGCIILDCSHVTFGDDVMLAPNVQVYAAHHPLDAELRVSGAELASPIHVGSRVWIGGGTILLPGISIGDDCVIGAGSVVTKDIPPRTLAVGNPCRVLRAL
jgi:maltose O-acetyltransferase